jgi:hypothetical protein
VTALWLAAALVAPDPRAAFIEAYVAAHREEVCGTHWVGNPTHAACLAMLKREAEAAYARGR